MNKRSFTIADCFSFIKNGANIKQDKEKRGYPITRIETTSNNVFNRDKVGYAGIEDITPYQDYVLEDGDLLMSHINSLPYLGRVVYYDRKQDETIIHGMNLLRLKAIKTRLRPKYATFLFSSIRFKNKILTIAKKSVNQASFSINDLKKVCIELPTVEEQDNIVDKLVGIQKIIQLRNTQLAKLDELVKCRFVELFCRNHNTHNDNLIASLDELMKKNIITYHLDGNHGSDYPRSHEFIEAGGITYISANCILNGHIDYSSAKHLSNERAYKLRKGIAKNGDVLFAHNATVGPVAILETEEERIILGTSLTAYRCNFDYVLPQYLKAYMESEYFVSQYANEMKQTTRNQVPITAQRKYTFIIPPIDLQTTFATFVQRIDKLRVSIQASLDKTQQLFDSLMQEYFD